MVSLSLRYTGIWEVKENEGYKQLIWFTNPAHFMYISHIYNGMGDRNVHKDYKGKTKYGPYHFFVFYHVFFLCGI